MQELKQFLKLKHYLKYFFYLIGIIITLVIAFYFNNHNNLIKHIDSKSEHLKENINSKSEHLKDNINQLEKKVNEFKIETKENFVKLEQLIIKNIKN